jgi:PAS domain S-box-containing protein
MQAETLLSPASGSFGPVIFATQPLYVQIGAASLRAHRSSRRVIHFPRRRLGFAEFFSRRWRDYAVRSLLRSALFLLLGLNSLWAVDPSRHISQYRHTAWRIQDGVFSGTPHAITQTTDGYLWIGTEAGLWRFDGVRFVPWTSPDGQLLPSSAIDVLLGARDGTLWIGTDKGLARLKNERVVSYSGSGAGVGWIVEDSKGTIWVGRYHVHANDGPLCRVTGETLRCYGKADGISSNYVTALTEDSSGSLWFGTDVLRRWQPGSSSTYFRDAFKKSATGQVRAIAAGRDGALWVGLGETGKGLGLQQFFHGEWRDYVVPGMDGSSLQVETLLVDDNNTLWIGTLNQGIYRVHEGKAEHFQSTDGLSGDSVASLFEDSEGNLWVQTTMGLDCFRDLPVATFSIRQGLSADSVHSVLASRDGTVWIGNMRALDLIRKGNLSAVRTGHGLPGWIVEALFEDHAGVLWMGIDRKLFTYEQGQFDPVDRSDGAAATGGVTAMAEDTEHTIWALLVAPGGDQKLHRVQDRRTHEENGLPALTALAADPQGGIWLAFNDGDLGRYRHGHLEKFPASHGMDPGPIRNIFVDSDGAVWGTKNIGGMVRWKDGTAHSLSTQNGLPCNRIFATVKDNRGSLWLYASCGIVEITDSELEKWRKQPEARVEVNTFDVLDGAQPADTIDKPSASRAPDGRLWFVNGSIVQMIDPAHVYQNRTLPPVHVEQIVADRKSYSPRENLALPSLTRDLEIDYTALSFVAPQKVRFRYKLEGWDRDWQDAGTRRQAFYSNLPPRNYRFRVMACNSSGVWNEAGTFLDFSVAPAYYQTWWFRSLCVMAFLALVYGAYRVRVGQLRAQEEKFREAIESIPAMAFVSLPDGYRTFVNKGWVEYTGMTEEQSLGSGWHAVIHPEDLKRVLGEWEAALASGKPMYYEARYRRAEDGQYRWFMVRVVPQRNKRGKIVKWFGTLADIEDRKRAEQEREKLRQLEADLAHTNRVSTLGEMAASLAHEIKQPIAAAITSANSCMEWLEHEPPNLDRARAAAARIDKYGNRAAEIIDRIRSFYKKSPPRRELVDVNGIIEEILTLLKCEANRYSVAMRTELAAELPKIMTDRVQLQQVFMNLMVNAIEAMKDSGGELAVKSQLQDGQLQFSVSDTGMGLPKEKIELIFDSFFTTKPQGSGMGLSISRSIVESHGGRLWATANNGRGATFHFTLPTAAETPQVPATGT